MRITRFAVENGTLQMSLQMSTIDHGPDPSNQEYPTKHFTFSLKDLYATCPVQLLPGLDRPPQSGPCSSKITEIPYMVTIKGPHNGVSFWVQDQDRAQRIARAFEHLIKLSGAKKEPF